MFGISFPSVSRSDRGFAFFPYRDYSIAYCLQYVNTFLKKNLDFFKLSIYAMKRIVYYRSVEILEDSISNILVT